MRRMSFALTTEQVRNQTKTVTRRKASTWKNAKPGDRLLAVTKVMGLKKGQRAEELAIIELVDVRLEPLEAITPENVAAEGFPDWTTGEFMDFVYYETGMKAGEQVRRIEFRYVDDERFSGNRKRGDE